MTLRHLKIFTAVCEYGTMTKASEVLHIAQPSISLAISELEVYYGVKLFERITKRLYITEAGKRFNQYATHIIDMYNNMEHEVRNFDEKGVIRVGASVTIANYLLPIYTEELKKQYPEMEIRGIVDNSDKIEKYILQNRIDIGLIEGIVHNPYIIGDTFREDELTLICSNQHPFANKEVAIEDVKEEAFIMREVGSGGREIFDGEMIVHGIKITPQWECISTQAIIKLVSKGTGIAVLPYLLVKEALKEKLISQFNMKDTVLKREFSIIYHKHKFLTPSAKYFIDICKNNVE